MYKSIYKVSAINESGEEVMAYFYTDYDQACNDGQRIADYRKKTKCVGISYVEHKDYLDVASTITFAFEDDFSVKVSECGWAQDAKFGGIRAVFGVNFNGEADVKFFEDEKEFDAYIMRSQPHW